MNTPENFAQLVGVFTGLMYAVIPVLVGMAFLVFVWGLAKFIFRISGDEKAVADGKNLIKWGLIALFILLSFQAIIYFLYTDIGFARSFGIPFLP